MDRASKAYQSQRTLENKEKISCKKQYYAYKTSLSEYF